MTFDSNNPGQHSPAPRHVGYVLHHPYIWQQFWISQYMIRLHCRDGNAARQAFAASVYMLHYYQSMEHAWRSTRFAGDIDIS